MPSLPGARFEDPDRTLELGTSKTHGFARRSGRSSATCASRVTGASAPAPEASLSSNIMIEKAIVVIYRLLFLLNLLRTPAVCMVSWPVLSLLRMYCNPDKAHVR
jgi:hypothetical protein